jgi:very-short-patch-repair endonuclease
MRLSRVLEDRRVIRPRVPVHPTVHFARDDVLTRRDLLAAGATVTQLSAAVHDGSLIRIRRGHYGRPDLDIEVQRAVRVGGQLSCTSELRRRGVWTLRDDEVHVQIAPHAARLRDRDDRTQPMRFDEPGCRIHWRAVVHPDASDHAHVGLLDALLTAVSCRPEREALAALDSALHHRLMGRAQLRAFAAELPPSRQRIVAWADGRIASGIETFVVYLCRVMGLRVRIQPVVVGVGRGDVEIEGVLIIEADSHEFHDAEVTARDRRRDAGYIRAGYTPLHFRYAQIVYQPREVAETILAALLAHRSCRNSGEIVRRARRRLDAAGIS